MSPESYSVAGVDGKASPRRPVLHRSTPTGRKASRRRFVVLDRDGTVIVAHPYLSDPAKVQLVPDIAPGLRLMRELGLGLVVITNQSVVGRGYCDESVLGLIHHRMCDLLADEGVSLDGIYYCPHVPDDNCQCRKPSTGLLDLASAELAFDAKASFVIGDKACDVELGQRVGATTFLVKNRFSEVSNGASLPADHTVDGLYGAALIIRDLLLEPK